MDEVAGNSLFLGAVLDNEHPHIYQETSEDRYDFLQKALKLGRLRRQRVAALLTAVIICVLYYWRCHQNTPTYPQEHVDFELSKRYAEDILEESLKMDKGRGCEIPEVDPFSEEMTQKVKAVPPLDCSENGRDWMKCYQSECRVVDEIKKMYKHITCEFRYILYESDQKYRIGPKWCIAGEGMFRLRESDHVKVSCTGVDMQDGHQVQWARNTLGLRPVQPKEPPPGREHSYNVLILGFDSAAKNGFIRLMPQSWKVLTEELGATVMHGFNILGDATPATMFPLLTGRSELELPDVRKIPNNTATMDSLPFIFYKLKEDGYRTAFFEDMPQIGSFQYRFNGWRRQPTDHYLRAFFLEDKLLYDQTRNWFKELLGASQDTYYCMGETPRFKLMMNLTHQFMELKGKRFVITFINDVTHDNFDLIQWADADTAEFLRSFKKYAEDTFLVVMGDHGPRFSSNRETLQGKLEERLPLLALLPPLALARARPAAAAALRANARALATPHDLHATLLDALGLARHASAHRVRGARLPRALSLLRPVPRDRSCSEAGVEPHWCACAAWQPLPAADPQAARAARALLDHVNRLLAPAGPLCAVRTLTSIDWVMRQVHKEDMLKFVRSVDADGYRPALTGTTRVLNQYYQVKIVAGPGRAAFEGSMMYDARRGVFLADRTDISRVNRYNDEPRCISNTYPQLNPYCYCL